MTSLDQRKSSLSHRVLLSRAQAQSGRGGASSSSPETYCKSSTHLAVEAPSQLTSSFTSLAAANFLLGCVGVIQVSRIFLYQRSLKNASLPEVAEQEAKRHADIAKGVVMNPEGAAKKAGVE